MTLGLLGFRHLPQVLEIEQRAYPWPWSEGMFVDSLRNGHLCYHLSEQDRILGYIVVLVTAGECHILNICVDPNHQGKGCGRRLLEHALAAASPDAQTARPKPQRRVERKMVQKT